MSHILVSNSHTLHILVPHIPLVLQRACIDERRRHRQRIRRTRTRPLRRIHRLTPRVNTHFIPHAACAVTTTTTTTTTTHLSNKSIPAHERLLAVRARAHWQQHSALQRTRVTRHNNDRSRGGGARTFWMQEAWRQRMERVELRSVARSHT